MVFVWYALTPKDTTLAQILLVGSYLSAYLNLFNLLPISPLDGGRITQAAGRYFKYVGLLALTAFSIYLREPVILYVWILVLFDLTIVPIRLRGALISTCWTSMAILMYLGYSDQAKWVDIMDCAITFPFVIGSVGRAFSNKDEEDDVRPDLSGKRRSEWIMLYFGLAFALVALIYIQMPMLPHPH